MAKNNQIKAGNQQNGKKENNKRINETKSFLKTSKT